MCGKLFLLVANQMAVRPASTSCLVMTVAKLHEQQAKEQVSQISS